MFIQPPCEFDMWYAIISSVTGTICCPVLRMAPWDCGVSKHSRVWWDIKDTIIQFGIHSSLLMVITLCQGDTTEWLGKKLDVFFTCLGQFVVDQPWKSLADILLPTLLWKINFILCQLKYRANVLMQFFYFFNTHHIISWLKGWCPPMWPSD